MQLSLNNHGMRNSLRFRRPPVVILNPFCSIHFSSAANLSNEDDAIRVPVILKDLQRIHKVCSRKNVTSHTNAQTLPQTSSGQ